MPIFVNSTDINVGKVNFFSSPSLTPGLFSTLINQLAEPLQQDGEAATNSHVLVFAGDHGFRLADGQVPSQASTYRVVQEFIGKETELATYASQHGVKLLLCDVGIDGVFAENTPEFVKFKIRSGTRNLIHEPAMTGDECEAALDAGRTLVNGIQYRGCRAVGFGSLGMGSETSAGLLMHRLTGKPLQDCIGSDGTDWSWIQAVADTYAALSQPMDWLSAMGGYEIAAIAGGIQQAFKNDMAVVIDGFVPTIAALLAKQMV